MIVENKDAVQVKLGAKQLVEDQPSDVGTTPTISSSESTPEVPPETLRAEFISSKLFGSIFRTDSVNMDALITEARKIGLQVTDSRGVDNTVTFESTDGFFTTHFHFPSVHVFTDGILVRRVLKGAGMVEGKLVDSEETFSRRVGRDGFVHEVIEDQGGEYQRIWRPMLNRKQSLMSYYIAERGVCTNGTMNPENMEKITPPEGWESIDPAN